MDPQLAQVQRILDDLLRRVTRLEQILEQRPPASAGPHLVTEHPAPSLESRVGSQYLNRAGIIALLFGVAFFLHWAFTNHWIGGIALLIIGLAGGAAIIGVGEWFLRREYQLFGFSLQGLGIAALYLTLWAAFQFYGVLPAGIAFAGMLVITAATALVAVLRNSEALAVLAAVGGFATPLLLSTGQNAETELFSYLVLLCAGMLLTLAARPWRNLLLSCFLGCFAVTAIWFFSYYGKQAWLETIVYFALFWATFVMAPLLLGRATSVRRVGILYFVPIAATLGFMLAADDILITDNFALGGQLAALALFLITLISRQNLRPLYFSLAVACSAVSIPAAVDQHWDTSAIWLAYGIALMLFGLGKRIAFVRWNALVLIGITVLKVFFFDLSNLGQGYRILALSVLGVALLSLSFLYQRDWLGLRKQ
jgi:uncharacterized membrane protein